MAHFLKLNSQMTGSSSKQLTQLQVRTLVRQVDVLSVRKWVVSGL